MGGERGGRLQGRLVHNTIPGYKHTWVKELTFPMMDHRIVNGLASPVSLSPCHPELGAKAPGPKAVEGAGRLTRGLRREVNL